MKETSIKLDELHISEHSDQSFRFKPIADSAIIRSLLA